MISRTTALAIAGIILIATGTAVAITGRNSRPAGIQTPTPIPLVSASPSPSAPVAPAPGQGPQHTAASSPAGTVEGSLSYPAQGIPSDLRVCAVNLSSGRATCTSQHLADTRFRSGQGYQLQLAPGSYQVYAVVPSFDPNYRAYYSRFVTCGYQASCQDHTPITITVTGGQTVTGIEPGDFYRT